MTICIAALCEDSKKIVIASDRMLTLGMLSMEFEHPVSKIEKLSESCVIMSAGSGLRTAELIGDLRKEIKQRPNATIPEIVDKVKEAYQKARLKKTEELFLSSRGLTMQQYPEESRSLVPDIAMMLDEQISTYDFDVDLLVAGIDNDAGHIYRVVNPGTSECFDAIGYHQIGSGEPHAAQCFIEHFYSQKADLAAAIWTVYNGKKRAEQAPGVGKLEEFAVIESGKIWYLTGEVLRELEEIRNQAQKNIVGFYEKTLQPKLKAIKLNGAKE